MGPASSSKTPSGKSPASTPRTSPRPTRRTGWSRPSATFPEWADIPVRFAFSTTDPNGADKLEAITKAYAMGVDFIKAEVRSLTGMSDPQPGDDVIGQAGQRLDPDTGKPVDDDQGDEGEDAGRGRQRGAPPDDEGPEPFGKSHFIRPGEVVHYAGQGPTPGMESA